ncbi:hypothetical protein Tco_0129141 [Tanacetum coccineum]
MVEEPLKMRKKDQDKVETDYELAQRLQAEEQEELTIKEKSKLFQQLLEKRGSTLQLKEQKKREIDHYKKLVGGSEVREEGSKTREESSSKRAGDELEQEPSKKQKMEDDKETAELSNYEMKSFLMKKEVAVDSYKNLAPKPPKLFGNSVEISKSKHGYTRPEEGYEKEYYGLGASTRTNTVDGTPIRSRGVCDSAVNLSTSQTYPSSFSLSQLSESTISVADTFLDTQARGRGRRHFYNDTSRSVRQNGTPVHSSNVISSNHSDIGCLTYSSTRLDSIPVSLDCVLSVTPQSSVSLSSSRSNALDNGTPVNLSNVSSITQPNRTRSRWLSIRAMLTSRLSNSNISDVDKNTTRSVDLCCGDGKVKLDYMCEPPALLTALCNYNGEQHINDGHGPYTFRLNGHNHHCIRTVLPTHVDGRPRFDQLYIYDTANETENRFYALNHHLSNNSEDETLNSLVQQLTSMLDSNNVLVKAFRMAKECFSDSSRQPVSI